jgi:hypothetical protein
MPDGNVGAASEAPDAGALPPNESTSGRERERNEADDYE